MKVDTLTHCFGTGNFGITNCSHATAGLANRLRHRNVTVYCGSSITRINSSFASIPTSAVIICAPTVPTSGGLFYFFHSGNCIVTGQTRILNAVAHVRHNLYITNARNGAAASAVATRVLGRDTISYGTFLNNVTGSCSDGLVLSSGDSLIIIRTSRFSHSFRRLAPCVTMVATASTSRLSVCNARRTCLSDFTRFASLVIPNNTLVIGGNIRLRLHIRTSIHIFDCSTSKGTSFCTSGVHVNSNGLLFSFIAPSYHITSIGLNIPILVGIRGTITTVTLNCLGNIAPSRLQTTVRSFDNVHHHFSFRCHSRGLIIISSCTRRFMRLRTSLHSLGTLCTGHGSIIIFRPRLCDHARSFCHRFTRTLSLTRRIILMRVCPTHRRPVPNIASRVVCSLVASPIGELAAGRRLISALHRLSFSILLAIKTKSVSACVPHLVRTFG